MDCAPFIRSKTILISWITVPALILIVINMAVNGLFAQQLTSFEQKSSLMRLIPAMQQEADNASVYLDTFRVSPSSGTVREFYITLINRIAAESGMQVDTITLDQDSLNQELGTAKVILHLQGQGTCRQIAGFLTHLKQADPLVFEDNLVIDPATRAEDQGSFKFSTDLIRIYVE